MNREQIVQQLIEKAVADPDFAARLTADPLAAAQAEGYSLDAAGLAAFVGGEISDQSDVVEALKDRVSMLSYQLGQLNAN
jgi:hypothetical protein